VRGLPHTDLRRILIAAGTTRRSASGTNEDDTSDSRPDRAEFDRPSTQQSLITVAIALRGVRTHDRGDRGVGEALQLMHEVFSPGTGAPLKGAVVAAGQGYGESLTAWLTAPRRGVPAAGTRFSAAARSWTAAMSVLTRPRSANLCEQPSAIWRDGCSRASRVHAWAGCRVKRSRPARTTHEA
jgi:hypothetical protein